MTITPLRSVVYMTVLTTGCPGIVFDVSQTTVQIRNSGETFATDTNVDVNTNSIKIVLSKININYLNQ